MINKLIILSFLFACSSDVSIMKRYDEEPKDTHDSIDITEVEPEEPGAEPGR